MTEIEKKAVEEFERVFNKVEPRKDK